MVGPALGGIVIAAAGTAPAFGIDAATFVVSAACLIAMRTRGRPGTGERTRLRDDVAEGLRYTRSEPWIWATLVMAAFALLAFIGPMDVLLPVFARRQLMSGARGYGFLLAVMGVGGILGALTASQAGVGRRRVRNMYIVWGVSVLPFAALALTHTLGFAMVLIGLVGFGFEVGTVMWMTLLQDLVPRRLMGRVRSLDYLLSFALMPLSYAIAGPLSNAIGVRATIAVGGLVAGALTFGFMRYPRVLDPDRDDYVPAPGSKAAEARV
jgi:Transmembrane secretion effector